jgi:tetratricopeptide (TPR) repeat protein
MRTRPFASGTAYEAFLRAEMAMSRGDPETASRQLELAIMADPNDGFLYARRAEVLLAANDRDAALDSARQATERFPQQAAGWLALGEVLAARSDRAGAVRAFDRALGNAPDDPEVRAAVTRAAGGDATQVARAIRGAPEAGAGDRTVAARMALDPVRDDAPTLRSVRRVRAREAIARGAYRTVEALLAPLVESDPTAVQDRVQLIEARAADGRAHDAARLVAAVPVVPAIGGVAQAERARLWLIAGRADLAAEEARAALDHDGNDVLARVVLGESLARLGRVNEAVEVLARVAPTASRALDASLALASALRSRGRDDLADLSLERAIARRPSDDAPGRDRLRVALAESQMRRGALGEARRTLSGIESAWGRQRRGAMSIGLAPPADVAADLAVRTGTPLDDGRADAWRVLLCTESPDAAGCTPNERDAALARARANAPEAPETLRALAITSTDRRRGMEYLRAAAVRDPLSPWNRVIAARFEHRAGP